ncbi:serine hydrolase-like protein 2 [Epargyreus clarus]|uniref:serine hydrolase-like protein 2 n=1 Tax=Epargyreus clarus TaxID=520877 RepID=UPI003C2E7B30
MSITEKEWFIEAPWGRICIVAWGHCHNPPVLLCHGLMDSMATFRPLIRMLPKNFYYIGVEMPGNGKSDPFPPGLLFNFYDVVYCLEVVVRHFRWESFMFLGHSVGASMGMLYDFCLPGKITRSILLDPTTPVVEPETFARWYKRSYQAYFDDYDFYNKPREERTVYTRKEALKKLMKPRMISESMAEDCLERISETVGKGLVRLTYDQRYKIIPQPPFSSDQMKNLCLKTKAQILLIATDDSIREGKYVKMPFLIDESIYNNNYRVRHVKGHHNIHIGHPERVATFVGQFLLNGPEGLDAKAKL